MSASLIGRLGSSTFRPSTPTVSMSLTGSCFSSESALRPFHHGIRRRGGTIYWTALPSVERQVQATLRTHLIHRPARDIIPPLGGALVFSYRVHAAAGQPGRCPQRTRHGDETGRAAPRAAGDGRLTGRQRPRPLCRRGPEVDDFGKNVLKITREELQ